MEFDGSQIQNAIYVSGDSPGPVAFAEWEARAAEVLEPGPLGYIAGGAGAEDTMRSNRAAFERRRLRPKMLTGNATRDLSVEILGTRSPVPFFLAPVGVLSIAHPDGELAVARAAAALGIPIVLSSAASHSMEEVAESQGPRWFQLYWVSDREVCGSLVDRAAAAGYEAIVVTVDTLTLGWRPRDLAHAYLPFREGEGIGQFTSDPVFLEKLAVPPEEDVLVAAGTMLGMFPNLALGWDDLAWLRDRTELPILLKGILRGDDASKAFELGVDGIVVSNHGGRQVDGSIAALDALVEVRAEVGREPLVLMDSGIRSGADVVKALALGADAALIGRPYVYGLAAGGQEGVETVLRHLAAETDLTLALMGVASVRELDSTWIAES
jgi:isopentenyl diphosphate isomerase/L-lactate dehydrogenase-like FMN-dependent dehydrogenase